MKKTWFQRKTSTKEFCLLWLDSCCWPSKDHFMFYFDWRDITLPTIIFTIQLFSWNEMTFRFSFPIFFFHQMVISYKYPCLAITLKVTNLMLYWIDSSFYSALAETRYWLNIFNLVVLKSPMGILWKESGPQSWRGSYWCPYLTKILLLN